ncbi:hypothetical protein BU23DRAFT_417437, partial [Bimuria novae-zelandiae CBS 107.79]
QEHRTALDKRNRQAYYRMVHADRLLPCKLEDANKAIDQFMINKKANMDPATNARWVAKKFNMELIHLPMLAIPLFRIPDTKDASGLPASQQATVGAAILLACSAAGDLQATLQILNAVYYSSNGYNIPLAAKIARYYSPNDINNCKKTLQKLAEGEDGKAGATGDANAMTLHGKFLELEGKTQEARYFYDKAVEKYDLKVHRGYPHPMALPWLTPWMAFVSLERSQPEPSHAKIKQALEFGALKADDPLAYYQLATLQQEKTPTWLAYMNKAAASGHVEAMYTLGKFYISVGEQPSSYLKANFEKAFNFMMYRKDGGPSHLGIEWLRAAGLGGHREALDELA